MERFVGLLGGQIQSVNSNATTLETFDYKDEEYLRSLAQLAAPGAIIGVLSLLSMFIFIFLRGCCNCCGPGDRKYTKPEIRRTKICIFVVCFLLCGGFVIGFVGNGQVTKGVGNFLDKFIEQVEGIKGDAAEAGDLLVKAGAQDAKTTVSNLLSVIDTILENTLTVRKNFLQVDYYRSWFMLGAFAFPILGTFFAFFSMITKKGWVCWLYLIICFLSLFVNWISFSVHLVVRKAFTDVCVDVEVWVKAPLEYNVNNMLQCVGSSDVEPVRNSAIDRLQELQDENVNPFLAVANPLAEPMDLDFIGLKSTSESKLTAAIADSKSQIARIRSENKVAAADGTPLDNFLDSVAFGLDSLPLINSIQTCKTLRDIVVDLQGELCGTLVDAMLLIVIAHAVIGVVLLPGVLFGGQGLNRFSQSGSNMTVVPPAVQPWTAPVYQNQYAVGTGYAPGEKDMTNSYSQILAAKRKAQEDEAKALSQNGKRENYNPYATEEYEMASIKNKSKSAKYAASYDEYDPEDFIASGSYGGYYSSEHSSS